MDMTPTRCAISLAFGIYFCEAILVVTLRLAVQSKMSVVLACLFLDMRVGKTGIPISTSPVWCYQLHFLKTESWQLFMRHRLERLQAYVTIS